MLIHPSHFQVRELKPSLPDIVSFFKILSLASLYLCFLSVYLTPPRTDSLNVADADGLLDSLSY